MAVPNKQLRFGGSKVKTGCISCKARHVKCDEGKPACQRCTKAKRICEYAMLRPGFRHKDLSFVLYSPQVSRSPSPLPGLNAQEKRAYDFFRACTAIQLAGAFDTGVWTTIILQTAHSESAITHAVIALGALHETFGNQRDPHAATSEYAIQHYNRAIQLVVGLDFANSAQNFDITLITCIIFAAFESLRGHYKVATTHVAGGVNILAETDPSTGTLRKGLLPREIFIPTFTRLENQLIEIDEKSPGPKVIPLPQRLPPPLPYIFNSIGEAQVAFDYLVNRLLRLFASDEDGNGYDRILPEVDEGLAQQIFLVGYFTDWMGAFVRSGFPPSDPGVLILHANITMLQIAQNYTPGATEMLWDEFIPQFEEILDSVQAILSASSALPSPRDENHLHPTDTLNRLPPNLNTDLKPSFTFSLGIITPLYFVCTRCRAPIIRRRALQMLSTCNRKEGLWDSAPSAQIAERIIEFEESESKVAHISNPSQIPVSARVTQSDIFLGSGRQGQVRYRRGVASMKGKQNEEPLYTFTW